MSSETTNWIVEYPDGSRSGPLSDIQMNERIGSKTISLEQLVSHPRVTGGLWVRGSCIPELKRMAGVTEVTAAVETPEESSRVWWACLASLLLGLFCLFCVCSYLEYQKTIPQGPASMGPAGACYLYYELGPWVLVFLVMTVISLITISISRRHRFAISLLAPLVFVLYFPPLILLYPFVGPLAFTAALVLKEVFGDKSAV